MSTPPEAAGHVENYDILSVLGEGTFGKVLKARDRRTHRLVALKRVKQDEDPDMGFPISALREINILRKLREINKTEHVITLLDIVASSPGTDESELGSVYLVFEYMKHDLLGLIKMHYDTVFTFPVIKCFMRQILLGVCDLHISKILHRDIKASNLLVNDEGVLKIADFGLSRPILSNSNACYTPNLVTLWYRPPEMLMADQQAKCVQYSTPADMWSVGCVFAEMLFRNALFRGRDRLEVLESIFSALGTPTPETAPELLGSKDWSGFTPKQVRPSRLKDMCKEKNIPDTVYELLIDLLAYDPSKRLQASDALDKDCFWTEPLPCRPIDVPRCNSAHEYTSKLHLAKQMAEAKTRAATSTVQVAPLYPKLPAYPVQGYHRPPNRDSRPPPGHYGPTPPPSTHYDQRRRQGSHYHPGQNQRDRPAHWDQRPEQPFRRPPPPVYPDTAGDNASHQRSKRPNEMDGRGAAMDPHR